MVKGISDLYGLGSGTVTLTAFNQFGVQIGQVTDIDNTPLGHGPVLALSAPGIQHV